jgi:hypothetical protein
VSLGNVRPGSSQGRSIDFFVQRELQLLDVVPAGFPIRAMQ